MLRERGELSAGVLPCLGCTDVGQEEWLDAGTREGEDQRQTQEVVRCNQGNPL